MPDDIERSRTARYEIGAALLGGGGLLFCFSILPVVSVEGVGGLFTMPPLLNWLAASAVILFILGTISFLTVKVGAEVRFRNGGISVRVRNYFRSETLHDFDWAEVRQIDVVRAGARHDALGIVAQNGASASFPARFVRVGLNETLERLRLSAEQSGFQLERTEQVNALVLSKEIWIVSRAH